MLGITYYSSTQKENSFSLRELADVQGCTSVAGGRMPGETRMRGYKIKAVILFDPRPLASLSPTLSRRDAYRDVGGRVTHGAVTERELTGQQ
jgi:hypothetical protein